MEKGWLVGWVKRSLKLFKTICSIRKAGSLGRADKTLAPCTYTVANVRPSLALRAYTAISDLLRDGIALLSV